MSVPVLFLHGWAMQGAVFNDLSRRLGPAFECHIPDLPGHGARCEDDASIDACVALAKDWIDRLDQPILVGWSMGAAVAWSYLAKHGAAKLRALVTVDMSPRMVPDTDWDLGLRGQSAEHIYATSEKIIPKWPRLAESIAHTMFAPGSAPVMSRSEALKLLLSQNPAHLRPLWDDMVAMDMRASIAKIDIPYLVCSGAQSRLYADETSTWLVERARYASAKRFAHSGHSPHLEEPDAFCEALCDFVKENNLAAIAPKQEVKS
ncbi:MAG: alpha/beta fold hydrolase [Pseudomonadota bacterium]|nr:alpha/beta fold hydrolase [Pseudomonadota bacterium]